MRNPSYMDIFCLANYPADDVLQDVQGVLKYVSNLLHLITRKWFHI